MFYTYDDGVLCVVCVMTLLLTCDDATIDSVVLECIMTPSFECCLQWRHVCSVPVQGKK